MAYSTYETQMAVNMAEQALQQRQIPFDIIFDQQLEQLNKYYVIVLADQESLTDESIAALKQFVKDGGGLVITGNTGNFDGWRRLRKVSMPEEMLVESDPIATKKTALRGNLISFDYGKGKVIYLPELIQPKGEVKLGFESVWMMPENANELESAVYWTAGKRLPLRVTAPEWIGVSHDTQENREIIHLFNYQANHHAGGITIQYHGKVNKAWAISPDEEKKPIVPMIEEGGITELRIPEFTVYSIVVLDRK
jgi:hypothetical protein